MCSVSSPSGLVECLTSIPIRSSTWNFSLMHTVCKQSYAVACSSSFFPERIDSSFWYWDLEKTGASEWGAPTLSFPRKMASFIRSLPSEIPLSLLNQRFTSSKPSLMYCSSAVGTSIYQILYHYAFELDHESRQVCIIVTPFGIYQHH